MISPVEQPEFLYDVGSPWCWLAGERVTHALGTVPVWQPVYAPRPAPVDRAAVERDAIAQGLPAPKWPEPFPFDTRTAMLAATFAKQTGRAVAYSLAAMRQAFAAGRDLSVTDNVLLAAAACELHPRAVLKAIETRAVLDALREADHELPAVRVGDSLFTGPRAVEEAAALLPR